MAGVSGVLLGKFWAGLILDLLGKFHRDPIARTSEIMPILCLLCAASGPHFWPRMFGL